MASITIPDVLAFQDVLNQLAEESDSMSPERALELREALAATSKLLATVLGLIDTQLTTTLEQPRAVGSKVYAVQDTGKWRPNHGTIRQLIVGRSMFDENGEAVTKPAVAAGRAIDLCYRLFVSPKTMPKTEGIEALGATKDDVGSWEKTGSKLKTMELGDHG